MTTLQDVFQTSGATLAPDGIPLHFGDIAGEYMAAAEAAVLFDRSHEGRIALSGDDRFDLINRMSTNNILNMGVGAGRSTVFTNPNGRIIDRVIGFSRADETLLLLAGPGRGEALQNYLQRNIFFNDAVTLASLNAKTCQFALHGPKAGEVLAEIVPEVADLEVNQSADVQTAQGIEFFVVRRQPYSGTHYNVIVSQTDAPAMWALLAEAGQPFGLRPSGGLVYNALRIATGQPGTGHELSSDYIPLDVGLWNDISFNKGCYTGQEIIARMESRERVARTIVHLTAESAIPQAADLYDEGKKVGSVTSSVTTPTGEHVAIAVVKVAAAQPERHLQINTDGNQSTQIVSLLGEQPPFLIENTSAS